MNRNAQRSLKHIQITWIVPNYTLCVGYMKSLAQGFVAVALIKGFRPVIRASARVFQVSEDTGQEKIVKDNHAGHFLQQSKHVLVENRIAKVIEHSVVTTCVRPEPRHCA